MPGGGPGQRLSPLVTEGTSMLRNTRVQMLQVLAAGAVAGWLTGFGRLRPPAPAQAAPADRPQPAAAGCDGAERGVLLAQANPAGVTLPLATGQAASGGRKPNILVIFGDDIGQTNVSAYSMGLMGYR